MSDSGLCERFREHVLDAFPVGIVYSWQHDLEPWIKNDPGAWQVRKPFRQCMCTLERMRENMDSIGPVFTRQKWNDRLELIPSDIWLSLGAIVPPSRGIYINARAHDNRRLWGSTVRRPKFVSLLEEIHRFEIQGVAKRDAKAAARASLQGQGYEALNHDGRYIDPTQATGTELQTLADRSFDRSVKNAIKERARLIRAGRLESVEHLSELWKNGPYPER